MRKAFSPNNRVFAFANQIPEPPCPKNSAGIHGAFVLLAQMIGSSYLCVLHEISARPVARRISSYLAVLIDEEFKTAR